MLWLAVTDVVCTPGSMLINELITVLINWKISGKSETVDLWGMSA